MTPPSTLARQALRAALATRAELKLDRVTPVCPFDAADRLGVEVKFRAETSMEGMYCRSSKPTILVSTHRSSGRRSLTCAHELGHHVFGHGTSVDEVLDEDVWNGVTSPEERSANLFASFFLMPKPVVEAAFKTRLLVPGNLTACDIYRVACFLGVSYAGLIYHLQLSLDATSATQTKAFLRIEPKQLKAQLADDQTTGTVWPVDVHWIGRPVDVEQGDLIAAPNGTGHEGTTLAVKRENDRAVYFAATKPGIARLSRGDWNVFVRVQRAGFIGRSIFRHLEDSDAD